MIQAGRRIGRYHLWDRLPGSVRTRMKRGIGGAVKETPKPGERLFARVQNEIIGSNGLIIARVAKAVRQLGYHTLVLTSTLIGEAKEVAKTLGTIGREIHQYGRPIRRPHVPPLRSVRRAIPFRIQGGDVRPRRFLVRFRD